MRSDPALRAAVTLFAGLNLLDIASTYLAMRAGLSEANPIPSLLLATGGEPAMYLFKSLVTLLVIAVAIRCGPYFRRLLLALRAASGILTIVVLQNLLQLLTI